MSFVNLGATPKNLPALSDMALGFTGGAMGEVSAVAILIGLIILIWKKIISPIIPACFIGTVFVFAFIYYAATGDGILTSLMLMEACVEKKSTLCDLAKEMKVYPQVLRNVRVADKKEARENPEVVKAVQAAAEALGNDGRILVRESGTEPVNRVMVEAGTDEICHEHVDNVIKVMEACGLIQE